LIPPYPIIDSDKIITLVDLVISREKEREEVYPSFTQRLNITLSFRSYLKSKKKGGIMQS